MSKKSKSRYLREHNYIMGIDCIFYQSFYNGKLKVDIFAEINLSNDTYHIHLSRTDISSQQELDYIQQVFSIVKKDFENLQKGEL